MDKRQQCSQILIPHCSKVNSKDICTKCSNGYYLDRHFKCMKHLTVPNCGIYDPFVANSCQKCKNSFLKIDLLNYCLVFTQIPNCLVYHASIPYMCNACKVYYFLENNACKKIQISNCIILESNINPYRCKVCANNFVNSNGKCEQL